MQTQTWKGKRTDLVLVLLYFMLYGFLVHLITTFRHAVKYHEDFSHAVGNPLNILLTCCLVFFFMSPVWVYFRKVPKSLMLDPENHRLEIKKRRKTYGYNTNKIRYYERNTPFFFILEIHATFPSSKGGEFERLANTIIVPNWGLSWNRKKMIAIVDALKAAQIPEIKTRTYIPISEYFYD